MDDRRMGSKNQTKPSVWTFGRLQSKWIWRCHRKKTQPSLIAGKHDARFSSIVADTKQVNYALPTRHLHFSSCSTDQFIRPFRKYRMSAEQGGGQPMAIGKHG